MHAVGQEGRKAQNAVCVWAVKVEVAIYVKCVSTSTSTNCAGTTNAL